MKPFRLGKSVDPGGYMQFWGEKKPPTVIVTKFPQPKMPLTLITKVHPRGDFVEFVHRFN